jgi:hypothetical protein
MRFRNVIIALGFLVLVTQFTGFPEAWRNAFYIIAGLALIVLAYRAKPFINR